ncbi:testin LIM domain protein isoform X1 [Osmia lignaria lignaria]|uniref:testin LIM domain protein isoform X1 n=2 Tax=Osmia lignaria lignaria TaxID=1437193 RepID=UPI00402B4194
MSDIETNDRPKWLLELENRKRKPRLAHEAGAGAPCVTCKAKCPGLDLHFWRKICKNCKCSKDDHDVQDDDFPQFDLLFGSSRKYKKKPILLHINNEKEPTEEAFEWIPPDTTKELVIDYMKALPVEKLPIKGSAGAALRRQLLQKQLPLHDIDHKVCDKLSEEEKKQFDKYLENIKKYVGQGTVTKILSARPFDRSLVTPVNATDMQRFSPQNKPSIQSDIPQLRTPSSFTPKNTYKKNQPEFSVPLKTLNRGSNIKSIPAFEKYNIINNDGEIAKSEPLKSGLYNKGSCLINHSKNDSNNQEINKQNLMTDNLKSSNTATNANINSEVTSPSNSSQCYKEAYRDTFRNPSSFLSHSEPINDNTVETILADAFLPPSAVHANDIIGSTLDKKGLMYIREKLTNKYSSQENQGQIPHNTPNFTRDLDFGNPLYKSNDSESKNVNILANANEEINKTPIITTTKNPPEMLALSQDGIPRMERTTNAPVLTKAEKEIIRPSSKAMQTNLVDFTETINPENSPLSISSPQSHLSSLSTDNYQAKLNNITTPSTVIHSEKLQNQIFPHDTVGIAKQSMQDFSNMEPLKNVVEEITSDAVKPQKCHKCEEAIRVGDVAVTTEKAKNIVWHPGCFVCSICNELLVDLVYFHYKNKLYCGRDLATLLGIPRCFACDELIFVREYTVAEGHNYHVKHFCCWDCDVPLAGKQYITENDRPLCLICYQKTYAKTCNMCEKVIAADQQGVAVKDLNFHATETCFCCYICKKNLLNGRIAVKEKKIFCSKECITQFLHLQT